MDTTKEYILKCEKAKEIQNLRPQSPTLLTGNFVYSKEKDRVVVLYVNEHHGIPPLHYRGHDTSVWLPRQDQFQDMVPPSCGGDTYSLQRFSDFMLFLRPELFSDTNYKCDHRLNEYLVKFKSAEQLWLAFVMKKKYNKVWTNGNSWGVAE